MCLKTSAILAFHTCVSYRCVKPVRQHNLLCTWPGSPSRRGRLTIQGPGLLLGRTDRAIVRWMLQPGKHGDVEWWAPRAHSKEQSAWRVDHIEKRDFWFVYEVRLIAGRELAGIPSDPRLAGLVLAPVGKRVPLLTHIARKGFRGIFLFHLRKLMSDLGMKFARGKCHALRRTWCGLWRSRRCGDSDLQLAWVGAWRPAGA